MKKTIAKIHFYWNTLDGKKRTKTFRVTDGKRPNKNLPTMINYYFKGHANFNIEYFVCELCDNEDFVWHVQDFMLENKPANLEQMIKLGLVK